MRLFLQDFAAKMLVFDVGGFGGWESAANMFLGITLFL